MFDPIPMSPIGVELYFANKLKEYAISCLVVLTKYMSAPFALRYDTSKPKIPCSSL